MMNKIIVCTWPSVIVSVILNIDPHKFLKLSSWPLGRYLWNSKADKILKVKYIVNLLQMHGQTQMHGLCTILYCISAYSIESRDDSLQWLTMLA